MLLVTGGGGFVLCHLVVEWVRTDRANRAIVIDRDPLDDAARAFFQPFAEQIKFVQGDVSDRTFWALLDHRLGGVIVTHMVHGAAVSSIERHRRVGGLNAAIPSVATNIMGTVHALGFAETLPVLHRFINVSSGAVYARVTDLPLETPLPEDGYVAPDGLYPVSKYAAELVVAQTANDSGLPAVTVRLASVFGPLDRQTSARDLDCIPKRLLMAMRRKQPVSVAGLDSVGDYLGAGDVAAALVALLLSETTNHSVYNIAAGRLTTLADLLDVLGDVDRSFHFIETSRQDAEIADLRPGTAGRNGAYDIGRITADTTWRPDDLGTMLRRYHEWLETHEV